MINEKLIGTFSSIKRFSGTFLFQDENVPTHSIEMALLCINFSELVPEADKKDMCYRCIIHDFEEVITSDIPRPIKHKNPEIKRLIDEAGFEMLAERSNEEFAKEVFSAKDKSDINGFLVHIADRFQCFLKMSREVENCGNCELKHDLEVFRRDIIYLVDEVNNYELMSQESRVKLSNYLNNLITNY